MCRCKLRACFGKGKRHKETTKPKQVGVLQLLAVVHGATLPFVTTWHTSVNNEQITLPLPYPPRSPINVTWGDNTLTDVYDNSTLSPIEHTYATSGFYNVSIMGDIYGFNFASALETVKIFEIVSWGDGFFMDDSSTYAFAGCSNLVSVS